MENKLNFKPHSTVLKILYLIIIINTLTCQKVFSQGVLLEIIDPSFANHNLFDQKNRMIEGNPYFLEKAQKGSVILLSGRKIEDIALNLDIYGDLIVSESEGEYSMLNKKLIDEVSIYNPAQFKILTFKVINEGLYEILYQDSTNFILLKHIKILKKGQPGNGYVAATPDKLVYQTQNFVMINDKLIGYKNIRDLKKELENSGFFIPSSDKRIKYKDELEEVTAIIKSLEKK